MNYIIRTELKGDKENFDIYVKKATFVARPDNVEYCDELKDAKLFDDKIEAENIAEYMKGLTNTNHIVVEAV